MLFGPRPGALSHLQFLGSKRLAVNHDREATPQGRLGVWRTGALSIEQIKSLRARRYLL
jgi:hypothetical protein